MEFWEHEPETERRRREARDFRSLTNRSIFRRLARSSLRRRGIDPDVIPSISPEVNLSSRVLGQVSPPTSAYTPPKKLDTTYAQQKVATSAVGTDYIWEQSMAKQGYTPEQTKVVKKLTTRASELLPEGVKESDEDEWQKALKRAGRELSPDEAWILAPSGDGGLLGWKNVLGDVGDLVGWLEKQDPVLAGPFARTAEGYPHPDPEGRTAIERGAELSRPVARPILGGISEAVEQYEIGTEATKQYDVGIVQPHAVSGAIESKVAEDILTEVINPATLVLIAPLASQGIKTTMGVKEIAARLTSNMLGTGMEPDLIPGALRGLSKGGKAARVIAGNIRRGRVTPHEISKATPPTPTVQTHELKVRALDQAVKRDQDYIKIARGEVKAGTLSQGVFDEATKTLGQRRKDLRKAKGDLNHARIDNEREELIFSARVNGADDNVIDMLARAFDDSVASEPTEEFLLNAAGWRRLLAQAENMLTGTPPGVSGRLANRRDILHSALRRYTSEVADPIFKDVQKLLDGEVAGLTYTGPKKWAREAVGAYKKYHVVQHPEWFAGMSSELTSRLDEAQKVMRTRLDTARALGYPIEALDDLYLEQLWEIPKSGMTTSSGFLPGRVSVAKPRLFDDYLTGMNQGYIPRDMSVEELMQHSSGLLDQAVSDAWMRQEVLRRFGSRVRGRAMIGKAPFQHPLYRGYHANEDIVNWIEGMERVVGPNLKRTANVAARFKGTVFGVIDFAVTGVQIPLSIAHGGLPGLLGTLNRSLEFLDKPLMHLYAQDTAVVSRYVQAASDGVHVGWGPSSISAGKGTIVHYVPKVGKAIDAPITKVVDASAQAQFGYALTSVRMRMFEGNLMLLKATGKDILDPAVRRLAAEWANSITGASRGPMAKGRRALESIALTSTQMTRANLSVYGQLVKGLGPKASSMERLRTAITFGNLFATVYGVQYLFNSAFGDGPMEYIPGRPDWATVRVGGRTVPIIPQRSILRAVDKSLKIIERHVKDEPGGSLEDIPKAWAQVAIGKSSPVVGMPLAALDIAGFEPETGQYKGGDLTTKGRIVGSLPVPPLAEQAIFQERDPATLAIAGLGFNPYATSSGKMLQEQFTAKFDTEINWENETHRDLIENDPKLSKLWEKSKEESRAYGSEAAITSFEIKQEIEQAELDKGMVRHAEAVLSGDALAAQNWSDARANFLPWRSGKWDGRLTGRDPKTEEGQLANQLYSLNPKDPQFTDSSGATDWSAFDEARELILGQMPSDMAEAIRDKEKFTNPKAEQVDREFRTAQDTLRDYWDLDDGIWERLRGEYEGFHLYRTYNDFKAAKAQELINMGVSQQDIQWQLGRLPVITNIDQLIASVRFQHRLSHPDVDALLVKWYGNTPARAQVKAMTPARGIRRRMSR